MRDRALFPLGFLTATAIWSVVLLFQPRHDGALPKSDTNTALEAKNDGFWDKTKSDPAAYLTLWLVGFTGVLAASTIGLWIVSWRSGLRQSRDMTRAIAAAQEANDINIKQMVVSQRAWISVTDLQITDDIVFKPAEGGAVLFVSVKIQNIGRTPALDIHTRMETVFDHADIKKSVDALARDERETKTQWTRVLVPNDWYRREWALDIETPAKGASILPRVIGCVTYSILPDNSVHQTGFVFDIFESEPGSRKFKDLLRVNVPRIPKDRIGWDGGPGGFAD